MNLYLRRTIFKILKKSDLVYMLNFRFNNWREIKSNEREMFKQRGKKMSEIHKEIILCEKYWKCRASYYYVYYELYNKLLTTDELLDYVPPFYFANNYQERYQKGQNIVRLSNKFKQYLLFKERGIQTPEVVYIIKNRKLFDTNMIPIKNVTHLKEDMVYRKIYIKPVSSCGGAGIMVVYSWKEMLNLLSTMPSKQTYVLQLAINQTEQLNRINESCVNTLRVIVHEDGAAMKMKICILRMGRNSSEVDNSSQGGLSIPVNILDGSFADYATAEHGGGKYLTHPDSKYVFKGGGIENWHYVKAQVESYATRLRELRDIALDVAITDDGISIIEFNFGYGIDHIQKTIGGIRRILNVQVPEHMN